MNNEVLRRKMFRTILADSRAPTGILASSPEMVDTVSRRANGGLEARRRIAGQQFMRQFAGMPDGSRKPESYLQVLDRIKGLPYNQQVEELTKAGFGATIGPDVPDFLSRTGAAAKQRIGADIEQTKQTLGKVLAPGADKPVIDAIQSGIQSIKYATGLDYPVGEEGGLGPAPTAGVGKTREQILAERDLDAPVDIAGSPVTGADQKFTPDLRRYSPTDDDLEAGMAGQIPTTPAEELAAGQDSNKQTQKNKGLLPGLPTGSSSSATTAEQKIADNLEKIQQGKKTQKLPKKDSENTDNFKTFASKYRDFASPKEVDIAKIEEDAKKAMGFDPSKADEDKKNAFWMAVTQAGLAIAAGESGNALTNIAKGLSFGLDAYGKSISRLNEQQREDAKELRQLRYTMIKDAKAAAATDAANLNAYNQAMARLEQEERQFGITTELTRERDAHQRTVSLMTLENRMLADLNTAKYQRDMLDLKTAEALVNKAYKELSLLPDAQVAAISQGYMDKDGNVTQKGLDAGLETLGTTIVLSEIAATKGKTKTETDTQRANAGLAKVLSGDYTYEDLADAASNPLFSDTFSDTLDVAETIQILREQTQKSIQQTQTPPQGAVGDADVNADPLGLSS